MSSSRTIESRLRALEFKLGFYNFEEESKGEKDLESRLSVLEQKFQTLASKSLQTTWEESDKLMEELDPGTALTHQQQIAAPILYRRQEILASAATLKRNMDQVSEMLNMLLISQPMKKSEKITESQVTQAPILSRPSISDEDKDRLDVLQLKMADIENRMEKASCYLDAMLENYHTVVSAASEKMVLLDEELRLREGKE